jgi:tetratricopeptide (TPR) repeat protein
MKNYILSSAFALLIGTAALAQKDELKTLRKIYEKDIPTKEDMDLYKSTLSKLEPLATTENAKIYYDYYRVNYDSMKLIADGNGTPDLSKAFALMMNVPYMEDFVKVYQATLDYEKKADKMVYTEDILKEMQEMKTEVVNAAIKVEKSKNYLGVSKLMNIAYIMDPKDQEKLYFAASYALSANEYQEALNHFNQLVKLHYTGEGTIYLAKSIASDTEESFPTKDMRDQYVILKTHILPREEKKPSVEKEIYKSIAYSYMKLGKNQEAIDTYEQMRKKYPDDNLLITAEADVYYAMNDFTSYNSLIKLAIEKSPNDPDLYYNLGVTASKAGNLAESEKYLLKAIEIKPDYINAYVILAEMKLKPDAQIVEEMNKLGTSEKDNKRYAVLQKQRETMFNSVLPYLEKAYQLDPTNDDIKKTLRGVYSALNLSDKAKALKN